VTSAKEGAKGRSVDSEGPERGGVISTQVRGAENGEVSTSGQEKGAILVASVIIVGDEVL
jgi:hypothetical protein